MDGAPAETTGALGVTAGTETSVAGPLGFAASEVSGAMAASACMVWQPTTGLTMPAGIEALK